MKFRLKKTAVLLSLLVGLSMGAHAGLTYVHEHTPHSCHKRATRAMHGCHHTDDAKELRDAEKREKGKGFGNNPCTCPWWCFINGNPDPLMDW